MGKNVDFLVMDNDLEMLISFRDINGLLVVSP